MSRAAYVWCPGSRTEDFDEIPGSREVTCRRCGQQVKCRASSRHGAPWDSTWGMQRHKLPERPVPTPAPPEGSMAEQYGRLFLAMLDLAYFGAFTPSIAVRGTHVNYEVIAVGHHEFSIDNAGDVARLLAWTEAVRTRPANSPIPEPAP